MLWLPSGIPTCCSYQFCEIEVIILDTFVVFPVIFHLTFHTIVHNYLIFVRCMYEIRDYLWLVVAQLLVFIWISLLWYDRRLRFAWVYNNVVFRIWNTRGICKSLLIERDWLPYVSVFRFSSVSRSFSITWVSYLGVHDLIDERVCGQVRPSVPLPVVMIGFR
jgi:hypothetical protein